MSSSDVVIKTRDLSKCYQIYDTPRDRLKQFVVPRLQRLSGRAPNQYFREFWAIKGVSLEILKGETVGIIGRNGSGKSTLLQLICGTLAPTTGSVDIQGRIAALLELGSGFNPEFTGRENVYMNAAVLGLNREKVDERFSDITAFADIGEFIDQPVKTYSSGMYVRLAFAVSVHVEPDVLIVDEALSVGDIKFQNKCLRKIDDIRQAGCSILFVSHAASQVEAFCNRVVWLEGGCVRAIGDPAKLVREYVNYMVHGIDKAPEYRRQETTEFQMQGDVSDGANSGSQDGYWKTIDQRHNIQRNSEVDIKRVRVVFGNEVGAVQIPCSTQPVQVEAEIEFRVDVVSPLVAIGVFNNLNEPVIHINSANLNRRISSVTRPCHAIIRFDFTLPALRPGEYLIALGVDDGSPNASTILCHVYDAWSFQVFASGMSGAQNGYVQIYDAKIELVTQGEKR